MNESLHEILQREYLGNTLSRWLIAACIVVGGTLILLVIKRLLVMHFASIAKKTDTHLDDLLVDLIRRTSRLIMFVLAVFIAHHWVTLGETVELYIRRATQVVVWLQVGFWARGLLAFGIGRMVSGRADEDPARTMGASVLGFIGQAVLWTLVLLLCLQALGQNVTALIASLGVGGIAVALALQNILGDLFASIAILLDKPFVIGDSIVLGEFSGTVERIGIKTTRLRSVTGEEIVVGNSDLVSSRLRNFKRMHERRGLFTVGVMYSTPGEKLRAIPTMLREIVQATPKTRLERAHLKTLGDSAIVYEVAFYVQSPELAVFMDAQQEIINAILARFAREDIEFAFPSQTVYTAPTKGSPSNAAGAPQKELSRG